MKKKKDSFNFESDCAKINDLLFEIHKKLTTGEISISDSKFIYEKIGETGMAIYNSLYNINVEYKRNLTKKIVRDVFSLLKKLIIFGIILINAYAGLFLFFITLILEKLEAKDFDNVYDDFVEKSDIILALEQELEMKEELYGKKLIKKIEPSQDSDEPQIKLESAIENVAEANRVINEFINGNTSLVLNAEPVVLYYAIIILKKDLNSDDNDLITLLYAAKKKVENENKEVTRSREKPNS